MSICDYEGSDYKDRFWVNSDRAYEDAVERVALRKILPPTGRRLIEFGAGFGRLADLYLGYDEIVLFDYSRSLLEQAREKWGKDPRFKFVTGNLYALPFTGGVFDAAAMVRVIHHIADAPKVLSNVRATLASGATFAFEFANKRNLKAMARYALGRQSWSPYAPEPVEFASLNFDFQPAWMRAQVKAAGLTITRTLPVSYLRVGLLKRALPLKAMVALERVLQHVPVQLSPSVFMACRVAGQAHAPIAPFEAGLVSPRSGMPLRRDGDLLVCDADGTRWRAEGNLFDLKEPVS